MHIGLIGGIGPAATATYYRTLVQIYAKAGRQLPLTITNADARELTSNLEAGRTKEQAAIFASYIDRLCGGGCEIAAVTSMGGHFCIDELKARASLPLVDAIPALEKHLAGLGVARIGVLWTRSVMESGFYGITSVGIVTPTGDELAMVHENYIELAVTGLPTSQQVNFFHRIGHRLHRDLGADIIILGGTDLSTAFAGVDPGYPVLDSAVIHAEAIAKAAMNG